MSKPAYNCPVCETEVKERKDLHFEVCPRCFYVGRKSPDQLSCELYEGITSFSQIVSEYSKLGHQSDPKVITGALRVMRETFDACELNPHHLSHLGSEKLTHMAAEIEEFFDFRRKALALAGHLFRTLHEMNALQPSFFPGSPEEPSAFRSFLLQVLPELDLVATVLSNSEGADHFEETDEE